MLDPWWEQNSIWGAYVGGGPELGVAGALANKKLVYATVYLGVNVENYLYHSERHSTVTHKHFSIYGRNLRG